MNDKKIPVTFSTLPAFEEYVDEIKDIWDTHWLSNSGAKHNELKKQLMQYLQVPHITLTSSGHVALELAIAMLNLSGEVITTPYTFCSTTHAIVRNKLTPVFCDINESDYTINADLIEALITDKTSAIVATHVYGCICDVEKIQKIADKYGLRVIYDAAHAFGVKKDGISAATFGDASMISTHATKVFHTIEGGIIAYKDKELFSKLDYMTNFGFTTHEDISYVGTNAHFNEFEAAMGLCNLRHIDAYIEKRKLVYERYVERLSGCRGIHLLTPQKGVTQNFSYFPVIFDGYKENRDEISVKLEKENIYARKYFYPLTNLAACYCKEYENAYVPCALKAANQVLTLPMYADLTVEDADRICDIILK